MIWEIFGQLNFDISMTKHQIIICSLIFLMITASPKSSLAFTGDDTMRATVAKVSAINSYDPGRIKYGSTDDGGLKFNISYSEMRIHIAYKSASGIDRVIALPVEVQQLVQIRVFGNRISVHGWMNSALASDVAIFDAESATMLDEFWSYEPTSSPDGRWIAFQRFYPSHFVDGIDDQYLIYDLGSDARASRPLKRSIDRSAEVGMPLSKLDAGLPIFPLRSGEVNRNNIDVSEGNHTAQSGFFWSPDSRSVVFMDAQFMLTSLVLINTTTDSRSAVETRIAPMHELNSLCASKKVNVTDVCADYDYSSSRIEIFPETIIVRLNVDRTGSHEKKISVKFSQFSRVER